jgi:hypothetical protein
MEAEHYSEINVYCRLRPPSSKLSGIKIKYDDWGEITLQDDKEVGPSDRRSCPGASNSRSRRSLTRRPRRATCSTGAWCPSTSPCSKVSTAVSSPTDRTRPGRPTPLSGKPKTSNKWVRISAQAGVIPRTFHYMFEQVKHQKYEHIDFTFKIYFVEIYNDKVFDLLSNKTTELKIKGAAGRTG